MIRIGQKRNRLIEVAGLLSFELIQTNFLSNNQLTSLLETSKQNRLISTHFLPRLVVYEFQKLEYERDIL